VRVRAENRGEISGRLMGPRCRFATTIEVAYSFRPVPGAEGTYRVVIPEPSLWEPECPFLYHGNVADRAFTYGLRLLGRRGEGLYVNGRPFTVRIGERAPRTVEEAGEARAQGVNVVCADVREDAAWDLADTFGFFVLGRVNPEDTEEINWALRHRSHRACLLAWLPENEQWESLAHRQAAGPTWLASLKQGTVSFLS
jgi:hypothetical protein